ncbi:MAG TPA: amidohydrolase family protein [Pseudonocardia sp.]
MLTIDSMDHEASGRTTARKEGSFLPDPPERAPWCPIISVDDHYLEPASIFVDRVPAALRDRVPHVVTDAEGLPYWIIDDDRVPLRTMMCGTAGRPKSEWDLAPQKFEEFRSGVYDVHQRVRDMDLNGVWASLNFPSFIWGFAGKRLSQLRDPEAGLACVRAYNDWQIDEWCAAYPGRFIASQVPWLHDPEVAAQMVYANAERGFTAISFTENPETLGFPNLYSRHWDPLLRACEETGTAVNVHVGSSGSVNQPSSVSPSDVMIALFPLNAIQTVVDWIFSRIPLRFPGLKIVLSEGGVSWVPMVRERLTRAYRQAETSDVWSLSDPDPVEIMARNFWFTSIEDPSAFRDLDLIGEDNVMVESDYPHPDSSWPETQQLLERDLGHLDISTIHKLCFGNAAHVYRHPQPPTDLIATSTLSRSCPAAI